MITNEMTAAWNVSAQTLTETQISSLHATPAVRVVKYGRTISETSVAGGRNFFFDPYGRVFYTERKPSGSASWLSETWLGFNDFGDVAEHDIFIGSGNTYTAMFYAHDAFGRTFTTTEALGNAVTNAYDALGRSVATSGATYPVTHGYDTAGRMASLSTTRDGAAWDMTRWHFDPATGLVTNKIYADDTVLSYTYDAASRPLRTIWARGTWREHAYNRYSAAEPITYSTVTLGAVKEQSYKGPDGTVVGYRLYEIGGHLQDGLHFNERGNAAIANEVYKIVGPWVLEQ